MKNLRFNFAITLTLLACLLSAEVQASCDKKGICVILRPVSSGTSGGPAGATHPYYYRHVFKRSGDTIVFFHGGPGAPAIDSDIQKRFPKDFDYITTDIRGAGRNVNGWPLESISTDAIADDMVAVIQDANLKSFVLYGASFGTVIATKVAARLHNLSIATATPALQPRAVVLEGTLGQAFKVDGSPNIYDGASPLWQKMKRELPVSNLKPLDDGHGYLGLGYDLWGQAVLNIIFNQGWPESYDSLKNIFEAAKDSRKRKELTELIRKWSAGVPQNAVAHDGAIQESLMLKIRCAELGMHPKMGPPVLMGEDIKVAAWSDAQALHYVCKDLAADHPYDSANWQIHSPIYYFQGAMDPNTPLWQAFYHFQHQVSAKKLFFVFAEMGHDVQLSGFNGCRENVWRDLFGGRLVNLSSCKARSELLTADPAPKTN